MADKRFFLATGTFELAGANDNVVALTEAVNDLGNFVDGGGLIKVGKEADLSGGFKHARFDSFGLAMVGVFDQAPTGFTPDPSGHQSGGIVSGAVVNDDDFPAIGLGPQIVVDLFQLADFEIGGFIIGRDDHGKFDRCWHKMILAP